MLHFSCHFDAFLVDKTQRDIAISETFYMYGLLFIGSFIAAAISGAAGFGGALLLLPLLSKTIGTTMAVPVLTIAQLIGNLSRAFLGFKQIKWKPVIEELSSTMETVNISNNTISDSIKEISGNLDLQANTIFNLNSLANSLKNSSTDLDIMVNKFIVCEDCDD